MTTFYGARSDHCPLVLPCQIDLSDENLKYTTIVSERKDLLMTRGVSIQGSLRPGGGLSVQGVSVQRGSLSGGLCLGLSVRGLSPEEVSVQSWSLSRGWGSLNGDPSRNQKSGRYASYWNAFLLYR